MIATSSPNKPKIIVRLGESEPSVGGAAGVKGGEGVVLNSIVIMFVTGIKADFTVSGCLDSWKKSRMCFFKRFIDMIAWL